MNDLIKVKVKSNYLPNRSKPEQSYFLFSYKVKIINDERNWIKLLSRHWNIKDANGYVEDIYGPGVVGKQPKILPNEYFEYVSFCPLKTPIGFMKGAFSMVNNQKVQFDVKIEPFRLFVPDILN